MVYVSELQRSIKNKNWIWLQHAYLIADTVQELHDFATEKLGLRRSWFQNNNKRFPHYDLTARMRQKALVHGATEKSARDMVLDRRKKENDNVAHSI